MEYPESLNILQKHNTRIIAHLEFHFGQSPASAALLLIVPADLAYYEIPLDST